MLYDKHRFQSVWVDRINLGGFRFGKTDANQESRNCYQDMTR